MMRRFVSVVTAVLMTLQFASAKPANPKPFKYTQPDGTVIVLQNHGDEFYHWVTNEAGQTVRRGEDGFYRPVPDYYLAPRVQAAQRAKEANKSMWSSYDNPYPISKGDRKILVFLFDFQDVKYKLADPNQYFTDLLNKEGGDSYNTTGSVRDYFLDNSWNGTESLYRPTFDVFGPVTVSGNEYDYDERNNDFNFHVGDAIMEAYAQLKDQIPDIDSYDTDNNGEIDIVLYFFPGYDQAECGVEEYLWAHKLSGDFGYMGNKKFTTYVCSSELVGGSGTVPISIGTSCHELSHAIGLPDFYDTNYGTNGRNTPCTGEYDLMEEGSYNDSGRTPPYLNAIERNMLGWMSAPAPLSAAGDYALEAIQNNRAYRVDTDTPGEYFVVESRNGYKWDSSVSSGLLFYHVDQSDRIVSGGWTASWLWDETNGINCFGGHPCCYIVPAVNGSYAITNYVFPGPSDVKTYIPICWEGYDFGPTFTNIAFDGVRSSFTFNLPTCRTVTGYVKDIFGAPVPGARVCLTPSISVFAGAPAAPEILVEATTDANGYYSLDVSLEAALNQILTVSKPGYASSFENIAFHGYYIQKDLTLSGLGQADCYELRRYDPSLNGYYISAGTGTIACGMRYTADELASAGAVGARLKSISFDRSAYAAESGNAYVVADIGDESVVRLDVTSLLESKSGIITVDIPGGNIVIPEGKDLYVGLGFTEIPENCYPFLAYGPSDDTNGCWKLRDFLTPGGEWEQSGFDDGNAYLYAVSATIVPLKEVEFSEIGVSFIKLGADNVPYVSAASGKSPKEITWKLDGTSVAEPPATTTLEPGKHTYMARIAFYDGTAERVYYDVNIEETGDPDV